MYERARVWVTRELGSGLERSSPESQRRGHSGASFVNGLRGAGRHSAGYPTDGGFKTKQNKRAPLHYKVA